MEEKDVGILCFANSRAGFRAVLKQRYSDFIVNEVDLQGNVVHLTSLQPPPEEEAEHDTGDFSLKDCEQHLDSFKELAGEQNAATVKELLQKVAEGGEGGVSATLLPDGDKAHRTRVHGFFREKMPLFVTDTAADNCIRIQYNDGSLATGRGGKRNRSWKGNRQEKRQRTDSRGSYWPPDRKKFCQFYLYKENKTTQSALMIVAQKLGVKAKNLGFAGTKDKRAVTTQRVTVFKYSAKQLAALNRSLFGIKIGNFSYVDRGLVLGDLSGNRFTITLRDVVADGEDVIKEAAEGLGNTGFINYYGLQRFGNCEIPTYDIGAKLLRGDWKGAVDLILQPREGELKAAEESRKLFQTEGPAEALKTMPHHMIGERCILAGLKKDPTNFLQAIESIPRPMRMMYVHSYQSYLWNNAVTVRTQKYGIDAVVEGDLVYCQEGEKSEETNIVESEELAETETVEDDTFLELGPRSRRKVKHVTKEDVESQRYSVTDVVLPLIGSTTVFPATEVTSVYHDLAKKDGIDLKSSPHNVKEFSVEHLLGAYRHILVKPVDFSWKLSRYNDVTIPLSFTDLDRLERPESVADSKAESDADMRYLALQLEFTLPTSSYATMALREVMKMSTAVGVHKQLTEAQEAPTKEQIQNKDP